MDTNLTLFSCILFIFFASHIVCNDSTTIIFVLLIQPSKYHERLTQHFIADVKGQIDKYHIKSQVIFHQIDLSQKVGAWTFIPLFDLLNKSYDRSFDWILFLDERTQVDLVNLLYVLKDYDHDKRLWLGRALHDQEATIIHHFAFHENPKGFLYPNLASGFLVSRGLLRFIITQLSTITRKTDFSIDPAHELSLFMWNLSNKTVQFQQEKRFCVVQGNDCATYPAVFQPCYNYDVTGDNIYFAVKTCRMFHEERIVQVLKKTWTKYAEIVDYYSDVQNDTIPTIKLNVSNVEQGHCEKTKNILDYLNIQLRHQPSVKWVAIVDDDTIISISKLQAFLTCFNPAEPLVIGQRYGFRVVAPHNSRKFINKEGFNYVTGGGGVIISRPVLEMLTAQGACDCPLPTTPDDMYIFGYCLAYWRVPIIHSNKFHQARPSDYAPEYLISDSPAISFHKYWMIDPIQLYKDWFEEDDYRWWLQSKTNETLTDYDESYQQHDEF